jgi:hypothetical protein
MASPTPITLQEFNDAFKVRVVDYRVESTDITVYYEVKCTSNLRVSVHIATVDTTELLEGYTATDVIDAGWTAIKDAVNSWATTNVSKPPFTTFTPDVTTNDVTVTDFNNNFVVNLQRFELFPTIQPSVWCIGLNTHSQTRQNVSLYRDCSLSIDDFCNDTECLDIVTAAWLQMKASICSWAAEELAKSDVINTLYTPTDITPSE